MPLRIFVSATADLEPQRGVIARTLAELPVQVGAEIRRYPPQGTSYETLFELISNVDRVYFLMGGDITAPAGAEWDLALRLERRLVPLRWPAPLTPAAGHFLRAAFARVPESEWRTVRSNAELARAAGLDLIDALLHLQNRYGITVSEVERLLQYKRQLQQHGRDVTSEPGGSEGGGVILGRVDSL